MNDCIKRIVDIVVVVLLSVFWLPLGVIISVSIWIGLGRPIFFVQLRTGKYGKPFKIIKFRTMSIKYDNLGNTLSDSKRITMLGSVLRSLSLDELPEVINVLNGDMSLVGPRPLLMQYLDRYTQEQSRRHEVKPGITGWAQINGRNSINWEDKFKYDLWYVNNRSFSLDLKILWLTIKTVLKLDGVSHKGHVTMPEFKGVQKDSSSEKTSI